MDKRQAIWFWKNDKQGKLYSKIKPITIFVTKDKQNCNSVTNKLKDYLPAIGYTIESKKKRIAGKLVQCYFITGEWHDVEVVDNDFLRLVEAQD